MYPNYLETYAPVYKFHSSSHVEIIVISYPRKKTPPTFGAETRKL